MSVAELLNPTWITTVPVGIALLALAVWLYALDIGNIAQRVFAALLALRGLTFLVGPLRSVSETAHMSAVWLSIAPYLHIAAVPLVIAFLSYYPKRRGIARWKHGGIALAALALGLELWYFVDHSAFWTIVVATPAQASPSGPLFILSALRLPGLAVIGLVLAGDYRRNPLGSSGFSLFLIAAAFTMTGLFDGITAAIGLEKALPVTANALMPWGWASLFLPVLSLPIALLACVRLLPVLKLARTNTELQEIGRFFFVATPLAVLSPFAAFVPGPTGADLSTFMLITWRLLFAFIVAYALMRYQLFDIDLQLKAGVRRGIILAAFTITFFMVSEAAESFVAGGRGTWFGIASAGFLALAARPIQSFAGRAADKFMPDTKPIAEQTYVERLQFYLDQFQLISLDGAVSAKERKMLTRLQATLSLTPEVTGQLEATGKLPHSALKSSVAKKANPKTGPADSGLELAIRAALVTGAMALFFGMLSQGIETIIPLSSNVAGLIAAALVAVLLGPLESLADRLTHRVNPKAATEARDQKERHATFQAALNTAFEDGSLSAQDLEYLAGLQEKLAIPAATRWRMEQTARLHYAKAKPRKRRAAAQPQ